MTFTPPATWSRNIVVGIDPPTGWCVWTANGIVDAGQHEDIHDAKRAVDDAVRRVMGGNTVHTAVIEVPFGVRRQNVREMLLNAMAAGWWMRHFHTNAMVMWTPVANTWRRPLGIPADRELAKEHALKLVDFICEKQGRPPLRGPKGGAREHASEAVLMCLSVWMRCGMVAQGDVAHRVINALDLPYSGGKPFRHSAVNPVKPSQRLSPIIEKRRKVQVNRWRDVMQTAGGDDDAGES